MTPENTVAFAILASAAFTYIRLDDLGLCADPEDYLFFWTFITLLYLGMANFLATLFMI